MPPQTPSPLKSDLVLDAHKFHPSAITQQTHDFNANLIQVMKSNPKWWEVGAPRYREMRWNGETPLPKPVILPNGRNIALPSRDPARTIPCRIIPPTDTSTPPKGIFYHIHGGGWVLQSEHFQDIMLQHIADASHVTCVSVGYRLAPEHPYPAGNEDCFDVAEYLADHAEREFGAPLRFVGGDSAGGHLSVLTCFHLRRARPEFRLGGLVLNFGAYDISGFLPQAWTFDVPLVLDVEIMQHFIEAYVPNTTPEQRRDPWISPFFADLTKMKLPPALFTCGTLDCLMDDSVFMSAKWAMSGAESILKIYPGAPHGFVFFPVGQIETTKDGLDDITTFVNARM